MHTQDHTRARRNLCPSHFLSFKASREGSGTSCLCLLAVQDSGLPGSGQPVSDGDNSAFTPPGGTWTEAHRQGRNSRTGCPSLQVTQTHTLPAAWPPAGPGTGQPCSPQAQSLSKGRRTEGKRVRREQRGGEEERGRREGEGKRAAAGPHLHPSECTRGSPLTSRPTISRILIGCVALGTLISEPQFLFL